MEVTEEVFSVLDILRKRKWSEIEETTLIECGIEREGNLFGILRG